MNQSDQLNELFAALAKAQAVMGKALKDKQNPFYKSKYADLASVVDISRGPLTDNGLCVTQPPIKGEFGETLRTILGHSSGQWLASEIVLKPTKTDPQALGSYITFMRRYAYASIVGVVTKEDDDGEAAMDRVTEAQVKAIKIEMKDDKDLEREIYNYYKIQKIEELPAKEYPSIIENIINYFKPKP